MYFYSTRKHCGIIANFLAASLPNSLTCLHSARERCGIISPTCLFIVAPLPLVHSCATSLYSGIIATCALLCNFTCIALVALQCYLCVALVGAPDVICIALVSAPGVVCVALVSAPLLCSGTVVAPTPLWDCSHTPVGSCCFGSSARPFTVLSAATLPTYPRASWRYGIITD